ncbi:MAG: endonuclease/exonuclease/phosphatase family protein, partial [Candidatus Hydrogenedentes bacterium]|nr:endonuclease/exonuclease/phosphatase family protein [Candidatus Hydrogenedentota bacterium]
MRKMLIGCLGTFLILAILLALFIGAMAVFVNPRVGIVNDYEASPLRKTPPAPLAEPITLKIVTFNIQDMYLIGEEPRPERMRAIGAKLIGLDPDIVGFQEAFVEKDRATLIEQLKYSRLQHFQYYASALVGSGLLIASAYPIRETYFHRYEIAGQWYKLWEGDWWAGKGAALARIELPGGSLIDFYNTHAQAGYGNPYYDIVREGQMTEYASFIKASYMPETPVFAVGDLNCRVGDADFEALIFGAGLVRLMKIDSRIDHILGKESPRYQFEVLDT